MKYIRRLIHILLLVATITAHPCERSISHYGGSRIPNAMTWTYDEIVDWLDDIESGALDDFYDESEIPAVNAFLIGLARAGTSLVDTDDADFLESDIDELLSSGDSLSVLYGDMGVMLCRAWYKQPWTNSKKFFKHHKTLCIVGTAVVVATAIVIVSVAAVASGVAASAASTKDTCRKESSVVETTAILESLEDACPPLKEIIAESPAVVEPMTIRESFREVGSYLAHELVGAVADVTSIFPQFVAEVEDIAHKAFPTDFHQDVDNPYTSHHPMEVYEEMQVSIHQTIDQIFDTNQAQCYTLEAKASQQDLAKLVLPPPGSLKSKNAASQLRQLQHGIHIGKGSPIRPYSELQKLTNGKQGNLQAHHILEQRHMRAWKYQKEALANAPAQILSREEHAILTSKLSKALSLQKDHTKSEVLEAYRKVYKDYPGYLESIEKYLQ